MVAKRTRNRSQTEARFRAAVEQLVIGGGVGAVTVTAVAREAGADKMLIYRYFGDLEGLMQAVVSRPGFFPSFDDLCAGDAPALLRHPAPERARLILGRFVDGLMRSPVALELMAWEMIERSPLTAVTETARETLGLRVITELFGDQDRETIAAMTALLASALTYLLLRRRKIAVFDGLDLTAERTWTLLVDTAANMVAGVLDDRGPVHATG